MKDLKYLLAYTVPLSAYVSFESTGIWTYSAVFYAFIVLPHSRRSRRRKRHEP